MAPFREGVEEGATCVKPQVSGTISGRNDGNQAKEDIPVNMGIVQKLKQWGVETPKPIESCVHELIHERCQAQPDAPAVVAWDGDLRYGQLSILADTLAAILSTKGVGPEVVVPICSERSRWVVVAMLAVLKAGGAFVLLDPSHPIQRLKESCQKLKVEVAVSSREKAEITSQLASEVVVVDERLVNEARVSSPVSHVRPDNVAYAVFTSGTTGSVKCILVEHRSFSTGALAHTAALNLTSSSRVLQFASYSFDACLVEILSVLLVGGCVCISSETERRTDLIGAARRFEIN